MKLDAEQQQFVDAVLHSKNHVILTGKAGTGKSTALVEAVKQAKAAGMAVQLMAPTAMAASIHRDSGLESGTIHHQLRWNPIALPLHTKLLSLSDTKLDFAPIPDQRNLLIIDEASMIGGWLFNVIMRDCGDGTDTRPFGGQRLVLVGDWAQLPPVITPHDTGEEYAKERYQTLREKFGPPDLPPLYNRLYKECPPVAITLVTSHRANDEWYESLNNLRDVRQQSSLSSLGFEFSDANTKEDHIYLCYRRVSAHQRNLLRLEQIGGRPHLFTLRDGDVALKEGCKIIITSNRAGGKLYNGYRGIFEGVDGRGVPICDGQPITMIMDGNWGTREQVHSDTLVDSDKVKKGHERVRKILQEGGEWLENNAVSWLRAALDNASTLAAIGSGRIVCDPVWPILPGYAMTVHKAQGMTLAGAIIELDVFWRIAPVRLPYVALSRVRAEENVRLYGIAAGAAWVRADPRYRAIEQRLNAWGGGR